MPSDERAVPDVGPPRYNTAIGRSRLLSAVAAGSPNILLITAPGGYGKTVLASQLAHSSRFGARVWLDAARLSHRETIAHLFDACGSEEAPPSKSLLMPDSLGASNGRAMSEAIEALGGTPTCVVIDGLGEHSSENLLSEIADIGGCLAEGSLLVVTSRDSDLDLRSVDWDCWRIESRDLAFDADETAELLRCAGLDLTDDDLAWCRGATDGHPALTAVLARYFALRSDPHSVFESATDLASLVERLALEHLTADEREVLWAAALVRSGSSQTLARVLGRRVSCLRRVGEVLPLVRVGRAPGQRDAFAVHEIARGVLLSRDSELAPSDPDRSEMLIRRACDELASERRSNELMGLLASVGNQQDITEQLLAHGSLLLDTGSTEQLSQLLETVDPTTLVLEPRLLLTFARLKREQRLTADALGMAASCAELAAHGDDKRLEGAALLMTARLRIDRGDVLDAEELLEALVARSEELRLTKDDLAFAHAYLMICAAHRSDSAAAESLESRSLDLARESGLAVEASCFLQFAQTAVETLVRWDLHAAIQTSLRVFGTEDAPRALRLNCAANAGAMMVRTGQFSRARSLLESVFEQCDDVDLMITRGVAEHSLGVMEALASSPRDGLARMRSWLPSFEANPYANALCTCELAEVGRATGDVEQASADADEALRVSRDHPGMASVGLTARAEWCAARFAAGDLSAAVSEARCLCDELPTESHVAPSLLAAEAVLASAAYEDGLFDEAVVRMAPYEDHIASENANLWLATWTRTFPAFLPVIASAVGPGRLPSHMLRLIDEKSAREGLREAWVHLARDQWETLAHRLLSDRALQELEAELRDADCCRVRFFGGLVVQMPSGIVPDSRWRKRKARLLFAMLAVRRGQDVPRDMLLEYLWPEMDDERARNNFYVVWNALRSALDPEGSLFERCEYVESRGGICRCISECVRTDLDDFDEFAQELREAEGAGDTCAVGRALDGLVGVYAGDLLPGDVYDDWFGETREHYRRAFVDLVVRGARLLRESGDQERAAVALRSALVHDPVSEDAYRELLRCQIDGGQRTAAIETYMTCRERLADSLGLDPSEETSALYSDILAMEESPVTGTGSDPGLSQGLA